ncbi:MAG: helix-turn-helix transcriptional regulator [Gemmatimonadales bacterium]|nr:helix-turn-helix transcriptional regulator [Gemmatimonadales bacterium]
MIYFTSDHEVSKEIGARLRQYRLQRNLLVEDVARDAGLHRNTVLGAERGANPGLTTIVRILRVLGRLDALDAFLPPPVTSPLQLLEHRGKPRQRAGRPRRG